ncbi:MAG TPA: zf-HC2 domain-containing protein [Opitutaceae bacterium]|nr:zf-HC2 domain-containing protein [Opitutaceae bacterium]
MNDREFIELLNLYVDREISQEDALRLEAEV